ncbi:MAG TPA: hypothetical protein VIR58_04495 [Acidimicrobiales bacterium]
MGAAAFVAARDDSPPATTTTTSTSTTTVPASAFADAMSDALEAGAEVPLTPGEADCIANGIVATLGPDRLSDMSGHASPLDLLTEPERSLLVRAVVTCVPPGQAEALLGTPGTTVPSVALPDEDL